MKHKANFSRFDIRLQCPNTSVSDAPFNKNNFYFYQVFCQICPSGSYTTDVDKQKTFIDVILDKYPLMEKGNRNQMKSLLPRGCEKCTLLKIDNQIPFSVPSLNIVFNRVSW